MAEHSLKADPLRIIYTPNHEYDVVFNDYDPRLCMNPDLFFHTGEEYAEFSGEEDLKSSLKNDRDNGHMLIGVVGPRHSGKTTLIASLSKMLGFTNVPEKGRIHETRQTTSYLVNAPLLRYTFVEFVGDINSVKNQITENGKDIDFFILVVGDKAWVTDEKEKDLFHVKDEISSYLSMMHALTNEMGKPLSVYCNKSLGLFEDEELQTLFLIDCLDSADNCSIPYTTYSIIGSLDAAVRILPGWNMDVLEGLNFGSFLWSLKHLINYMSQFEIELTLNTYEPLVRDMKRQKELAEEKEQVKGLKNLYDRYKSLCEYTTAELNKLHGPFSGGKRKMLQEQLDKNQQDLAAARSRLMIARAKLDLLSIREDDLEEPYFRAGVLCYQSGMYQWAKQAFLEAGLDYKNVRDYMYYLNMLEKQFEEHDRIIKDYEEEDYSY